MTALDTYIRLESLGLWRPAPGEQRRDVLVFLGDATLVIADQTETALTHWSLPAVIRLNPGKEPALFAAAEDVGPEGETLEIDDRDMVTAIETVQAALEAGAPRPGRLRRWGALTLAALAVIGGVLWLPGALRDQAVAVTPLAARERIGTAILDQFEARLGPACSTPSGQAALRRLSGALGVAPPPRLAVLHDLGVPMRALPGGLILVDADHLAAMPDPNRLAAELLLTTAASPGEAPFARLVAALPLGAVLGFLTSGEIAGRHLAAHALSLETAPLPVAGAEAILVALDASDVPQDALQAALPPGHPLLPTLAATGSAVPGAPLLDDNSWIRAQTICD